MDPSTRALKVLVEGGISDALLAKYIRSLLGDDDKPAPRRQPLFDTPAPPVPVSQPVADSSADGSKAGLVGLHDELVRVNVRVDGRRTSVSFPKALWTVLERRYEGRERLKEAVQVHAVRFKGRGNRSAFVLDQLEAELAQRASSTPVASTPSQNPQVPPPLRLASLPPLTAAEPDLFSNPDSAG